MMGSKREFEEEDVSVVKEKGRREKVLRKG